MSATPSPNTVTSERAEDIASELLHDWDLFGSCFMKTSADGSHERIDPRDVYVAVNPGHVIKSAAEGQHYYNFFASLANEHGPANAALDTARREWAKREG